MGPTDNTGPSGNTGPTGSNGFPGYYGQFADTTTQIITNGSAYLVTYNTTELSQGVSIDPVYQSRIVVANAGVYNLQFSFQVSITKAGTETVTIWFRKNGLDYPRSATNITLQNQNVYAVAAWNFLDAYSPGEFVEIVCQATGDNAQLTYVPEVVGTNPVPSTSLSDRDNDTGQIIVKT